MPISSLARNKGGRPRYVTTAEARETVALLRANGVELPVIAKVLKISLSTLERYYRDAIDDGHAIVTAKVGAVLLKAALSGNINAATRWLIMKGGWHYPKGNALSDIPPEEPSNVVHFYLPPNGRDQPEPPITLDGEQLPAAVVERLKVEPQQPRTTHQAPVPQHPAAPGMATSSWARIAKG